MKRENQEQDITIAITNNYSIIEFSISGNSNFKPHLYVTFAFTNSLDKRLFLSFLVGWVHHVERDVQM